MGLNLSNPFANNLAQDVILALFLERMWSFLSFIWLSLKQLIMMLTGTS